MAVTIKNDEPLNLEESGIHELGRVLDCTQEVLVKSDETTCRELVKARRCDATDRELLQNHFPCE